ncbi:MAG: acetyl-CoA carboxylase biotin carboxyl carrier protein [Cyanobacteria bacterium SIG30]|nr:acetyl-CoA carboxylase biotin carboxyl carrier protein [Cyanobacteria bacterium SIG30]
MNFEIEYFEKLTKLVNDNDLSELSLQDGDKSITLKKANNVVSQVAPVVSAPIAVEEVAKEETVSEIKTNRTAITSPMVGSFYVAPSPSAEPFVRVGDTVAAGQVVCIIEAMKLMNEIESEVSGKITQICVQDGQSVEYGQVLMYVE